MSNTFHALCKDLHMNASSPRQEDLDALAHWHDTHMGTDNKPEGNLQQCFDFYKAQITDFLETTKPHVNRHDLSAPVDAFQGLSSLEHVVSKGLGVYLKTLNPSVAQINAQSKCPLLQLATFYGNLHTAEALLSLGSNPQEKNSNGEPILFTTLMLAVSHDQAMMQKKQAIFKWLVMNFPNLLEQTNKANDTIWHIMAIFGYSGLIKETLSHSKNLVFAANNLSHCPIHTAILNRQYACFDQFIGIEGMALLQDSKGRNALHYAVQFGNATMVRQCLDASPKDVVNARDMQGQTPLMMAIIANNPNAINIIQELFRADAAINLIDIGKKSALDYAVESKNVKFVILLEERS